MVTNLIILLVLLVLSAFFSATEVAFISLSDAKVSAMAKRKLPRSKLIKKLKSKPRRLLVAILIGNNIVNISAASFATVVASELFASAVIGITTGVMTLLVLIFGEIIPKSYASNHNKKFAIFSAPVLRLVYIITWPAVIIFEALTNLFAGKEKGESVSEDELKAMIMTGKKQGAIEKDEAFIINRTFQMNDISAEDIMTPRVQVSFVEDSMSIEQAADIITKIPHTRFPVVKETPDNIIGFVHSRDVLLAYYKDKENNSIKKIIRPILRVPQQMKIDDLLHEFQKKQTHMAVVMDEYGGTEGLVTLRDILEELVGEIIDEHEVSDNLIKRIDKNTIIVAGEEELRDVNDYFNTMIPGDPLDTIAEVILNKTKSIPKKGMEVKFGNAKCILEEVKSKVIKKVKIIKN